MTDKESMSADFAERVQKQNLSLNKFSEFYSDKIIIDASIPEKQALLFIDGSVLIVDDKLKAFYSMDSESLMAMLLSQNIRELND